jgi:hypothetical protein
MPIRQRILNKRQALGASAQAWIRGDRENCSVFFRGKHQDELEVLWNEYGDNKTMRWQRGMTLPQPIEARIGIT